MRKYIRSRCAYLVYSNVPKPSQFLVDRGVFIAAPFKSESKIPHWNSEIDLQINAICYSLAAEVVGFCDFWQKQWQFVSPATNVVVLSNLLVVKQRRNFKGLCRTRIHRKFKSGIPSIQISSAGEEFNGLKSYNGPDCKSFT